MKLLNLIIISVSLLLSYSTAQAVISREDQLRYWIQGAVQHNLDTNTKDYSKYISKNYIETLDGKRYTYDQWVQHMNDIKNTMKSYDVTYDQIIIEGDQIAADYIIHIVKNDDSKMDLKVKARYQVRNNKIVNADELTYLLNEKDMTPATPTNSVVSVIQKSPVAAPAAQK